MDNIFPSYAENNGLDVTRISRDPEVVKKYKTDPLVHKKISARTFLESYGHGYIAIDNADKLELPTLLLHGDEDHITSHDASKEFAEKAGENTTFISWKGGYHELHNEPDKEEVFRAMLEWLKKRV